MKRPEDLTNVPGKKMPPILTDENLLHDIDVPKSSAPVEDFFGILEPLAREYEDFDLIRQKSKVDHYDRSPGIKSFK